MRLSTVLATLVVLLTPQIALAQTSTSTNTTTSTSTITLTKTVHQGTATSTLPISKASTPTSSANSTSTTLAVSTPTTAQVGNGLVGAQGTGAVVPTTASVLKGDFLGNGASVEKSNLLVAGLAGVAAIVLGSSL